MSARFPFPEKWRPVWWLQNADDAPPIGTSAMAWFWRNFAHNFFWYVAGCADRRFAVIGTNTNWRDGGGWHLHLVLQFWPPWFCPYVSYNSQRIEGYLGWRHDGALGLRLTLR